jgi:hypothetical protein
MRCERKRRRARKMSRRRSGRERRRGGGGGGGGGGDTHISLILSPPLPPSHTITAGGHSRSENTPGRDPAGAAWLGIALAMACGVRPTRGGVEPKERWL